MGSLFALLVNAFVVTEKTLAKVVGNRVELLWLFPKFLVEFKLVVGLYVVLLLSPDFFFKT